MQSSLPNNPNLSLPRDQWRQHPHYPSQLLLLGSHANFRRINAHLVEHVRLGWDLDSAHRLFKRWIGAMRSHEAYEEYKLYPFLAKRFGIDVTVAEQGHQDLHTAYDAVIAAFQDEDRTAAAKALEHHAAVLNEHLDHEEELVIPCLLALPPEEFRAFTRS